MMLTFSKNTGLIRDTFEGVDDDIELVEERGTGRTLIAGNIAPCLHERGGAVHVDDVVADVYS